MKRLFGTDGIRAPAGEPPLDPSTARRFGAALGELLREDATGPVRVLLGRDTRESGPWLRDAVVAGLASRSVVGIDVGVISTPGLAYLVRTAGYQAAVMISASHNPFQDNGLKAFAGNGMKLADAEERRIEDWILDRGIDDPGAAVEPVAGDDTLRSAYVGWLTGVVPGAGRFAGMRLVLDCANGSAWEIAPQIFRHHGAHVDTVGVDPDGRNINLDCGSLHTDRLAERVVRSGADLGLAFDGDADRCLAVDGRGRVVDGDHILYITARRLKRQGRLRGDALVATIMSNFWLEERLGREGIRLLRAPVGDKYVLEQMVAEDLVLGGEQSGHIIFRDWTSTGDGILTGLLLLDTLVDGPPLVELMDGIAPYPQRLVNVRVRGKPDLRQHPRVGPAVRAVESELDGKGRVVLRYSGTEPLARVMVEARDAKLVDDLSQRLARVVEEELG